MNIITRMAVVALAAAALPAFAQQYPVRPVRAIIAFPAGSGTDVIGRIVTQKVSEYWGQQVVADNRGGAGGSIASGIVAKAAPDGYTLLINSNAHAVNPSFFARLPYDTLKDFVDIGLIAIQANVLIVPNGAPFKSLQDFLKGAKAKPRSINFAFAGVGSGTHLNNVKFAMDSGAQFTDVAYKGSGEAIIDVMGGRADAYFTPISAGIGYIQSGKVRALAISTAKRSAQLPNVPTIAENGLPGYEHEQWYALFAPAKTPAATVQTFNREVVRIVGLPDIHEQLLKTGHRIVAGTSQQLADKVKREIEKTRKNMKE